MNLKKYHRYVALVAALPLLIVSLTGTLLLVRNQFEWIQPSPVSKNLVPGQALLTLESIQLIIGNESEIDQIIYRPKKNNLSVRLSDGNEVQLNPQTGEILKKGKRQTSFLIDIHQGSWLGNFGQYGIYLPAAFGFIFLIFSGIAIYPFKRKKIK